jgi:hypothetical protein
MMKIVKLVVLTSHKMVLGKEYQDMDNNTISNSIKWKDRKRFFGIPCTFTKYSIENDRLYVKTGLLKTEMNEILLYRILDIKSTQKLS